MPEFCFELCSAMAEQVWGGRGQGVDRGDDVVLRPLEKVAAWDDESAWASVSGRKHHSFLSTGRAVRKLALTGTANVAKVAMDEFGHLLAWRCRARQRLGRGSALAGRPAD